MKGWPSSQPSTKPTFVGDSRRRAAHLHMQQHIMPAVQELIAMLHELADRDLA